jgi:hypothetical protein
MTNVTLENDFVESDIIYGPMPNFTTSFEQFFIEKCAKLLYNNSDKTNENESNKVIMIENLRITIIS